MKKIILMLTLLMLTGMTTLAGEVTVSGLAEYKLEFKDELAQNSSDQDLILKISKELDETTTISLEYDTDDQNPDVKGLLLLNKKLNEKVEVQVAADVITETGMELKENEGGDTYIKLMVSDKLTVNVKPYEAASDLGDELETKNTQDSIGLEIEYAFAEGIDTLFVINTEKYTNLDNKQETAMGIKAEATIKTIENLELIAGLSFNTKSDVALIDGNGNITEDTSGTELALNVRAAYTMGALSLNGEMLYAGAEDAGIAIYGKGAYDLGARAGFESTKAYVEIKITDEDVYIDEDTKTDMQEFSFGITGVWSGVSFTPEFVLTTIADADVDSTGSITVGVEF